jgi:hypothetical protein
VWGQAVMLPPSKRARRPPPWRPAGGHLRTSRSGPGADGLGQVSEKASKRLVIGRPPVASIPANLVRVMLSASRAKPKANVYVDGFNLYYGALKNTPYKWLDLDALLRTILPAYEIHRIRYFSARI